MPVLTMTKNGDIVVASFNEAKILDEAKIQQVSEELTAIADRVEHGKLLLNFGGVKFMSSSVLGRLVQLNKKCKTDKTDLKMCNISPEIMEVFKITRLNKVFDIHADEASAIQAFQRKGWFG